MSEGVEKAIEDQQKIDEKAYEDAFNEASNAKSQEQEVDDAEPVDTEEGDADEAKAEEKQPDEKEQEESHEDSPAELSLEERLAQAERERDELRHKFSSTNGRINAYQKKIDSLTKMISDPDTKKADRDEAKDELAKSQNLKNWNEFKEEFPEFAVALDERISEIDSREQRLIQRFEQLEGKIQPIAQSAEQAAKNQELAALKAAHPDCNEVALTPEFDQWLKQQPAPVQQLIDSDYAADAAYLLDNFKRDSGQNGGPSGPSNIQRNRDRLKSNIAVQSKPKARRPVAEDDYEAAFNEASRAKRNR